LLGAERLRDRVGVCELVSELGEAMNAGDVTGDRVDVVARAAAGLSAGEKVALAEHGSVLAAAAGSLTMREFRRTVDGVLRRVRADDGLDRLARQRRATRLRSWTDNDGMWNLSGSFDPESGALLEGRLRNAVERLFHDSTPEHCPVDPIDRQQFLAAHALLALSEGRGGSGAPDVTVLIDERTLLHGPHEESVVEVGGAHFDLPVDTIRRWACLGAVTPVVVAADGARIWLGRETRLANRQQRRALRVLYRTCALCDVPFERCQIHHVVWYRIGGFTDIENLLPLCGWHHHLAHEGGWSLLLLPDRTLVVTTPDGVERVHGPPRVRAA
jgi:hypothetical protein